MVRVAKSDDGKNIVVMDGKFAASYVDGKWVSGARFTGYELSEYFRPVKDKTEAAALTKEAREALEFARA
jgi:hypothetical protein